jgi:hypothetical protein
LIIRLSAASTVSTCGRGVRAKDVLVQECIAELALWVMGPEKSLKIRQLLIERSQSRWWHREQLGPVRAWIERRELLFDLETARRRLFDRDGKTADGDLLAKCAANLLRLWCDD